MLKADLEDNFVRNNFIYFAGTVATAFLNYFFCLVLGRLMTVPDFGEVQALFSLLTSFTVLATVFRYSTVNMVARPDDGTQRETLGMMQRLIVGVALIAVAALVIMSGRLRDYLHFDSRWPFIGLAAVLLVSFLLNFRAALAHGLNDFVTVAKGNFITAAAKLAFSILFVILGMRVLGPILALFLGAVLSLIYLKSKTWRTLEFAAFRRCRLDKRLAQELRYVLLVLVVNLCLTLLYMLDTLVVKRYFPATEAGLYSGIATIGRIIFFGTASLSAVVLSSVRPDEGPANAIILRKALLLAGGLGTAAMVVFALAPEFTVRLVMGARFLPLAGLLPKVALISCLASVAGLLFFYFLALRRYFLFWIASAAAVLLLVLSRMNHGSMGAVADNFIYAGLFTVLALMPLTIIEAARGTRVFAYVQDNFHRRPGA